MSLCLKPCTHEDVHTLRDFSCRTFVDTFAHLNTPSDMKAYLEQSFEIEKMRAELLNKASSFYFLYADEVLAGYLKLNEAPAQTDIHDSQSLEIERIYLAKEWQGRGLGGELMARAIEIAQSRKKQYIWLGVWDENEKAIRFYQKNGFYKIGAHSFFLGDSKQTDLIMRKDI